jgi:hypothetical protein
MISEHSGMIIRLRETFDSAMVKNSSAAYVSIFILLEHEKLIRIV